MADAGGPGEQCLAVLTAIEFGAGIAAAFCGKLLADYGTAVLKVDRSSGTDSVRGAEPSPAARSDRDTSSSSVS